MDLSKLSNEDLLALKSGDLSKVSNEGLVALRGTPAPIEPPAAPQPQVSPIESAALSAGNSALAGLGKPLLAGVQTGLDKLGGDSRGLGELYNSNRGMVDEAFNTSQQQNPIASGAGSVAGGVLSPINKIGAAAGAIQGGVQGYEAGGVPGAIGGSLLGAGVNKLLGAGGSMAAGAVNKTAIYAKPLTDAIQQESGVVAPSFTKAAAKLLTGQPLKAAKYATAATTTRLSQAIQTSPEKFGRYTSVLKNAAQRGTLPVTSYILSQMSPEYRQQIENIQGEDND